MRHRRLTLIAAAVTAALAAALGAVAIGAGSSHREAPLTSLDPTADDTDVYAYVANDAQDAVTLVANWIPFEDPAGGPNFYRFDDRAHYYINVDNTGDGKPDIRYLFQFTTQGRCNPNSFLYAKPGVDSINIAEAQRPADATRSRGDLERRQDDVEQRRRQRRAGGAEQRRAEDHARLRQASPVRPSSRWTAAARCSPASVDDPFFVDLGATFDALTIRNGTGNAGGGKDDLAGYNVHSIVLQVPKSRGHARRQGRLGGPTASNAVVGVWASTDRQRLQVLGSRGRQGRQRRQATSAATRAAKAQNATRATATSRLHPGQPPGQPARSTRSSSRSARRTSSTRRSRPTTLKNFGQFVLTPSWRGSSTPSTRAQPQHKETGPDGHRHGPADRAPGLRRRSRPTAAAADTLKINLGVPPSQNPSRFGVLGGDTAGFPDGRRLTDDVVDIEERVVGGS